MSIQSYVIPFNKLGIKDIQSVGGKNASLGEMICHLTQAGVKVPPGFATTVDAYHEFIAQNGLDQAIYQTLSKLNVDDISALKKAGKQIRQEILSTHFHPEFVDSIYSAYENLSQGNYQFSVAVRSSATAEDLPQASFAGQQETFLNVRGVDNVLDTMKHVYASLFTDRAIAYRVHQKFPHDQVGISVGVQMMVRSDLASSGVMFSLDTESGFKDVVFITSSYGLGEMIVQGEVNPDEFYVYKPALAAKRPAILKRTLGSKKIKMIYQSDILENDKHVAVAKEEVDEDLQTRFSLTDDEIAILAEQAVIIEKHYGKPMDIEWAKDGLDNQIYILQARPETVKSRSHARVIERFEIKQPGKIITTGRAIGQRIGKGIARVIQDVHEMDLVQPGDVLVADMTDPDWEPIMKRASAIVTNRGGRTCHAAIIAREMGIPAVVGCGDATKMIKPNQMVTVSCAEGDVGHVYDGNLDFEVKQLELNKMPEIPVKIMMNVANPDRAFDFQALPNAGVGLARLEFIISQIIGVHPKACLNFDSQSKAVKDKILLKSLAYGTPQEFYVKKLVEGIATLGAAFHPNPVIVRMSDFKTNEYANLIGGQEYEPHEENPMIGFRGASRYVHESFAECFALECQAIRTVRETMGLKNVEIMIPFVRTIEEAKSVIETLENHGLKRGQEGLRIIMMCEVPSNAILAEQFLEYFDGFSIGSNDLTQLTLGIDRDSGIVAGSFDERDPAVRALMQSAIRTCRKMDKYIGICGQGPSDHPDLAKWLLEEGITSMSLNPDTVLKTWMFLANEQQGD